MSDNDHNNRPAVPQNPTSGEVDRFRRSASKVADSFESFNPIVPEPQMPENGLAKLYTSWAKNEIEWRVYKRQYSEMAERQAELLKEKANHIIAKTKVIHKREIEQLKEVLVMHNSEVISGLQQSSHDIAQNRLVEIAEDYMGTIAKIKDFPNEIREVLHQDAARVWDHARQKVLKYALEQSAPTNDSADAGE